MEFGQLCAGQAQAMPAMCMFPAASRMAVILRMSCHQNCLSSLIWHPAILTTCMPSNIWWKEIQVSLGGTHCDYVLRG